MSDVLTKYQKLFFNKELKDIVITESEFHYAYNRRSQDAILGLKISYPLLRLWHSLVKDGEDMEVSFVELLEWSIPGNTFMFIDDRDIRSEINGHISKLSGSVNTLYKTTRGRGRIELNERSKIYHVKKEYIKSVHQWIEEADQLENKIEEWRKSYSNLEQCMKDLYSCLVDEIRKKDKDIQGLKNENKQLENYITGLERRTYKGKSLSESKNKNRTLKCFLSRAQRALWFSKWFGIEVESVVIKDESGDTRRLNLNSTTAEGDDGADKGFNSLLKEEKEKVEKVLFLLDKFCVGDMFYHEFSFVCDGLPKSYLIKQCRDNYNSMCHITSLPGSNNGCQVNSVTDLLKESITDFLKTNPFSKEQEKVKIKINGDGARMTRNSNYIILSFSLLQSGQDVMSAKGNRTVAIVNSAENYFTLKEAFHLVFQELNKLIKSGFIELDGDKLKTEFFLGGDYKFILMMLGLKGATADYACAWCKTPKIERWNVAQSYTTFNKSPLKRTLKEIINSCKQKPTQKNKYNYSCEHEPLINIELDHVIVDELHLMLRITDRLLANLINHSLDWDVTEELDRVRGQEKGVHLKRTVEFIRSLGISFNVWEVKNADGTRSSGRYDWTSLMGDDKKKLLYGLTEKEGAVELFQKPDVGQIFLKIWKKFADLYTVITNWSPDKTPYQIWSQASSWVKLFVSLNGKLLGHERSRVTPYMHILVAHVPHFFKLHKSIKVFTGQGVEKNNDVARNVLLRKSNKQDGPGDILRLESRQWQLRSNERQKRGYTKSNTVYWNEEIKSKRKK